MKTLTEMAQEAGFETMLRKGRICGFDRDGDYTEELERFAELVRAEEREACAKVCDDLALPPDVARSDASIWEVATLDCAAAIRARGSNT